MAVGRIGRIGRKKEGFQEFLQRVADIDEPEDSELFDLDEQSKELDHLAHGFRHHALRTQLQQDQHLRLYQQWARVVLAKNEVSVSDEDIDRLCFPDPSVGDNPWDRLASQLRRFLTFAMKKCVPRSTEDDTISYRVLIHYRRNMIFWVLRKYPERHIDPPKRGWLEAKMTEMMRYLQSQVLVSATRSSRPNRSRVGT